jgi:hypothetical protein
MEAQWVRGRAREMQRGRTYLVGWRWGCCGGWEGRLPGLERFYVSLARAPSNDEVHGSDAADDGACAVTTGEKGLARCAIAMGKPHDTAPIWCCSHPRLGAKLLQFARPACQSLRLRLGPAKVCIPPPGRATP